MWKNLTVLSAEDREHINNLTYLTCNCLDTKICFACSLISFQGIGCSNHKEKPLDIPKQNLKLLNKLNNKLKTKFSRSSNFEQTTSS